jgi:hypothetical protein
MLVYHLHVFLNGRSSSYRHSYKLVHAYFSERTHQYIQFYRGWPFSDLFFLMDSFILLYFADVLSQIASR